MVAGEIDESTKELSIEFIPVDEKEFEEVEVDISDVISKEELIEKINNMHFREDRYLKIVLIGNRKIELEISQILRYILNPNIIKIKDNTKLEIGLEKLAAQNNLKGLFVKTLLEKKIREPENKEKIEKAIEIGLAAFN